MIRIIEGYISPEEEQILLSNLRVRPFSQKKERNHITRYGSPLPYKTSVTHIIPSFLQPLVARLSSDNIIHSDSITINEYHPGQSIAPHIDSLSSGPTIVVLSLESEATMVVHDPDWGTSYLLKPRSLLIMTGIDRTDWEHSIQPVPSHRFSIVFRKGTE